MSRLYSSHSVPVQTTRVIPSINSSIRFATALSLATICLVAPALAQRPSELPTIDGETMERLRLGQLLGRDTVAGIVLRSSSAFGYTSATIGGFRWGLL